MYVVLLLYMVFFFFQAEDGIRDGRVTGVQTCALPILVRTCPHANSCLTCPMFLTTAEFLPQHHAQRQATLQIISAAEAAGHARVAEMNRQVASNLDKIIATLEDKGTGEKEASAGAS